MSRCPVKVQGSHTQSPHFAMTRSATSRSVPRLQVFRLVSSSAYGAMRLKMLRQSSSLTAHATPAVAELYGGDLPIGDCLLQGVQAEPRAIGQFASAAPCKPCRASRPLALRQRHFDFFESPPGCPVSADGISETSR